jgi:hypothetical protein
MSSLKPEVSIGTGLALAALTYTIYGRGLPPAADMRMADPGNSDLATIRKQNAWMAAATVAGISLIAKDATIFVVGGAMVVGLDWVTRHAEWVNPLTGKVDGMLGREDQMTPTQAMDDSAYGDSGLVAVGDGY